MKKIVMFLVVLLLSKVVFAQGTTKPEELFSEYVALGEAFDIKLLEFYSDDAKISFYRVYPHGLERAMEFTAVEWKDLIVKMMPISKAKNDISTYSNIVITELDSGYKIKADRYPERKCYTDTGYYMILKFATNGQLMISEEYFETKPMPDCR